MTLLKAFPKFSFSKLNVSEATSRHHPLAKSFGRLDTDKDGTLDAREVLAFFQKQR